MIECEESLALICQKCIKDLYHADLLRKKCLRADKAFRSKIPQNFFDKSRLEDEDEDWKNLNSDLWLPYDEKNTLKSEEIEVSVDILNAEDTLMTNSPEIEIENVKEIIDESGKNLNYRKK